MRQRITNNFDATCVIDADSKRFDVKTSTEATPWRRGADSNCRYSLRISRQNYRPTACGNSWRTARARRVGRHEPARSLVHRPERQCWNQPDETGVALGRERECALPWVARLSRPTRRQNLTVWETRQRSLWVWHSELSAGKSTPMALRPILLLVTARATLLQKRCA